jgi:hypothetical protein
MLHLCFSFGLEKETAARGISLLTSAGPAGMCVRQQLWELTPSALASRNRIERQEVLSRAFVTVFWFK